jgi:hypothetical protein
MSREVSWQIVCFVLSDMQNCSTAQRIFNNNNNNNNNNSNNYYDYVDDEAEKSLK